MTNDTDSTKIKLSGAWPEWMDKDEAKIANKLISSILEANHEIRVRDEEGEVHCKATRVRAEVQKQTAATGITLYDVLSPNAFTEGRAADQKHTKIGTFVLIHGNGTDLISDYSWPADKPENEAVMEALQAPAQTLADSL